ncbi:DUF4123 domain-containing protein [Pseudomonas sp. 20GA0148]|nr:DUF4123 domain-containing protein [Pseudomonas alliivorans]
MRISLLLERTDDLLEKLYHLLPDPKPHMLFDRTELAPCRDKSPLWLAATDDDNVLRAVHDDPEKWPGLIIESPFHNDILLAHLRHLSIVNFEGIRRGVLRYSNPVTASYFFTTGTTEENAPWFGPISRLSWYGGTWPDLAQGNQRWMSLDNPHASRWTPATQPATPRLSDAHEHAFRHQERERFAYDWWKKQSGVAFAKALDYLDEGMAHGFATDPTLMNRYLSLRAQHPDQEAPPRQYGGTGEARLNTLRDLLQQSARHKESV